MKKLLILLLAIGLIMHLTRAGASVSGQRYWRITTAEGVYLTDVAEEPALGDEYISCDNLLYEIVSVGENTAVAHELGGVALPSVDWLEAEEVTPVSAMTRRIALYCTHSDESYEPSDGVYSSVERGSIYQVADALASALERRGVTAIVSDALHHPHDAGAYRRSRQTATRLLQDAAPDALIDVHRDGIPDPASYEVIIGGEPASKVRLLVGRGNQNMDVNRDFALMIKAVADRIYPGLIKDIYMGRGAFNQDLLPRSILLECGTYTLDKERVLTSMPLMARVIDRALYGGVVGSAGQTVSDAAGVQEESGGVTMGQPDLAVGEESSRGIGSGLIWVGVVVVIGLIGYGVLSSGSLRGGMCKAGRSLSEMTGGLIGKKSEPGEDHEHSGN